ncbi:Protein yippee-like [Linum grandiflorum]
MIVCVNVLSGELEDRQMMTGWHTVVDIQCVGCGSIVGWKYVIPQPSRNHNADHKRICWSNLFVPSCSFQEAAQDLNQMYKVGKFIIERFKVRGPDGSLYEQLQEEGSDSE